MYVYIYIYIYVGIGICIIYNVYVPCRASRVRMGPTESGSYSQGVRSPRYTGELSGRLPTKFDGHGNSHPLELRVCLSPTL